MLIYVILFMTKFTARLVKRFNAAFPRQKDGFDSRISLLNNYVAKIAQLVDLPAIAQAHIAQSVEQRYRKP
jgi:hypothetical protein